MLFEVCYKNFKDILTFCTVLEGEFLQQRNWLTITLSSMKRENAINCA